MALLDGSNYQFELDGLAFGRGMDIRCETIDIQPGDTRTGDADGYGDFRRFGRDRKTPETWQFLLHTTGVDENTALASLAAFTEVCDTEEERNTPGAVVALKYRIANRTRVVFGRPRDLKPYIGTSLRVGHLQMTFNFDRVDLLHYEDGQQGTGLGLGASSVGGFRAPFRAPLRSLSTASAKVNQLFVGGTAPTWAIVTFKGGQTNPWVEVDNWRLQLTQTVPYDDEITVDSRPWKRTVTRKDGAHVPGWLSIKSRMAAMRLQPNRTIDARYGADATTGDVTAQVRWTNAHKSF